MTDAIVSRETRSRLSRSANRAFALVALLILAAGVSGCNKLRARDLLNKGVAAFKEGQFDKSVEFFKEAKQLDPDLLNARLYLATAYASEYIPGAPSEENKRHGEEAIAEYKSVLEKIPDNLNSIDGLASILYQMAGQPFDQKKFEESKTYHQKHIALKPLDPGPYYSIGIKVNPEYDDAMTYLNLLYRRKADMVESTAERDTFTKQADDLLDKVKEIKQKRAEQADQKAAS